MCFLLWPCVCQLHLLSTNWTSSCSFSLNKFEYTCVHSFNLAYSFKYICSLSFLRVHPLIHSMSLIPSSASTPIHSRSYIHSYSFTYTHSFSLVHTRTRSLTHTRPLTRSLPLTHSHSFLFFALALVHHAHSLTRTQTFILSHSDIHSRKLVRSRTLFHSRTLGHVHVLVRALSLLPRNARFDAWNVLSARKSHGLKKLNEIFEVDKDIMTEKKSLRLLDDSNCLESVMSPFLGLRKRNGSSFSVILTTTENCKSLRTDFDDHWSWKGL